MQPLHFLTFQQRNGRVVEITSEALQTLILHRQRNSNDAEAGGVLIGRDLVSGDIIIDEALGPNPADFRARRRFSRDRRSAQEQVSLKWQQSDGIKHYLGDWHTHPENSPCPSIIDVTDWVTARRRANPPRNLIFIISGRTEIGVWQSTSGYRPPTKLRKLAR